MNTNVLHLDTRKNFIVYQQYPCGNVEIVDIAVGSERRKGTGRRMMDTLIHRDLSQLPLRCLLIYAVTRLSNTIAHQFYESCGFRIIGRLHNFYQNQSPEKPTEFEHALMYGRDL